MTSREGNIVLEEVTTETKEIVEKEGIENEPADNLGGDEKKEDEEEEAQYKDLKSDELENHAEDKEMTQGESVKEDHIEGEHVEHDNVEEQGMKRESDEQKSITETESKISIEGEHLEEEHVVDEQEIKEKVKEPEELAVEEEVVQREDSIPFDPTAPLNLTDSKELLREPFELRPEQIVEIEQLWEIFQDYTPAYTDIKGYITEVELVYMLKALLLMTYTREQLNELIEFCVRPPSPQGHITYEQFLSIVTLRQRDYDIEDELKNALQVLDPNNTGKIGTDFFIHVVGELGEKMLPKVLTKFVAEVDLNNEGELGLEDIYGTMCNDLGQDDIERLRKALITPPKEEVEEEEDSI